MWFMESKMDAARRASRIAPGFLFSVVATTTTAMAATEEGPAVGWVPPPLTWTTPTPESAAFEQVRGGMPVGNGNTVATVFPITKAFSVSGPPAVPFEEGVHVWVTSQSAMASDASLLEMGLVSLTFDPPLDWGEGTGGVSSGSSLFSQTLDFATGMVTVTSADGGTTVRVWMEQGADCAVVTVKENKNAPSQQQARTVTATIHPLRSTVNRTVFYDWYDGGFPTSNPGRVLTNFKTYSGPDKLFSTDSGSGSNSVIGLYQRNHDDDVTDWGNTSVQGWMNGTFEMQGLGNLTGQFQDMDVWRHRQNGFAVSGRNFERVSSAKSSSSQSIQAPLGPEGQETVLLITALCKQTPSASEWEKELMSLHQENLENTVNLGEATARHTAFWSKFWDRSHISLSSNGGNESVPGNLTTQYHFWRYISQIQGGVADSPIKFNGLIGAQMKYPSVVPSEWRAWGSNTWWKNNRYPYWAKLYAGDYEQMETTFEFFRKKVDLWEARTKAAFGHSGIYRTETMTYFGLYSYAAYNYRSTHKPNITRDPSNPWDNVGYEQSEWLKFDFGGNAGPTEVSLMILDHYTHTLNETALARYMPIISGTLDFFAKHYGDVETKEHENLTVWPTQVLETYQCKAFGKDDIDCPTNDHPTISALYSLTERLLDHNLTSEVLSRVGVTESQLQQWRALQAALPPIPMTKEGEHTVVSPFETFDPEHPWPHTNAEYGQLFSTFPMRHFTVARALKDSVRPRDIDPSVFCLLNSTIYTCELARQQLYGWDWSPIVAAMLGQAEFTAEFLSKWVYGQRTKLRLPYYITAGGSAKSPSSDHPSVISITLQNMLLQTKDDGFDKGGMLLFPAWPCKWDVDFKLSGPRNTTVSGSLVGSKLVKFTVSPVERTEAVQVLPCQA